MLLRILVFVAPEHEEVLGGRRPALVRRSMLRRRAPAGPSAGMTATASTTTSAGETFRAALGSGGKGGSSTQAERSALVEAVGGSLSSAIRLRRARARAGGIARRVWRSAIFHSWESARGDSLLITFLNSWAHFRKVLCRIHEDLIDLN